MTDTVTDEISREMAADGLMGFDYETQPESYGDVERAFWENMGEVGTSHFRYSQMADLFRRLFPELRRHAEKEGLTPGDYDDLVTEARGVVRKIAQALCARIPGVDYGMIWPNPTLLNVGRRLEEWNDVSPVDVDMLNTAVAGYLERPWMQSNTLEWYILQGYLFDDVARLSRDALTGDLIGITNWAYIFAKGDVENSVFWRAGLEVVKFVLRWLLLPALAAGLFLLGYEEAALWAAGAAAAWLGWSLVTLPLRWMRRRRLEQQMETWRKRLRLLTYLYVRVLATLWAPAEILCLARQCQDEGVYFCPAVMSLLRRAEERDPSVFIALPGVKESDL